MDAVTSPNKTTDTKNFEQPLRWRDVLPVHPAAELFPLMSEDELKEFAADIKANGLRVPIILGWNNAERREYLIDGRNRLDALELNGRKLVNDDGKSIRWSNLPIIHTADKPWKTVISANIKRRHLTAEQRRDLITKVLKATPETSNLQIAKQVGRDDKTVAKVRAELESRSEIPNVKRRIDTKGREQPAHIKRVEHTEIPISPSSNPDLVQIKPSKKMRRTAQEFHHALMGEPLFAIGALQSAWREVEEQAIAGNKNRFKAALQLLLKETAAALAQARSS